MKLKSSEEWNRRLVVSEMPEIKIHEFPVNIRTMEIVISYPTNINPGPREIEAAVALDHIVIPEIIAAVNGQDPEVIPALGGAGARIYDNVVRAMNDAEEAQGPEGEHYVHLMQQIRAECARRIAAFTAYTNDSKYPIADWQREVSEGDTRLGYTEWLEHKREAERK